MLLKRLTGLVAVAMFAMSATNLASATYNYGDWDVSADAGTYGPIALGDTITLDACGSTYFNYYSQGQSHSLCSLSSLTKFTLTWKAKIGNTWSHITQTYSGNDTADGLQVTVNTGSGTFFSSVGTYMIGLYVTADNNSYVYLPGGGYGFSNDNGGYDPGNQSLDWSGSFAINEATSVPEPAAALLLLPGMILIARRERRRRKTKIIAI